MTSTHPILVTAATGKTGRRVADRLTARGHAVRGASRSAAVPFDWEDRDTWAPAVRGARAAYLAYAPDLAVPGAAETVGDFAALAAAEGLERLVLLSGRGEPGAEDAERRVLDAGLPTTVVRAAWFMQNFTESFMAEAVRAGEVALPAGDVGEPFVDADDLADVAVAALIDAGHAGRLYDCTGPRLLSFVEATRTIAAAAGRPVTYTSVPFAAFARELEAAGMDAGTIELMRHLFTEVLDGRNARTGDGVTRALGRPPRDLAAFAAASAPTGVWAPDPALR